jgi:2-polyprenyl-6-hydroxyphenyl methylase/3-demethylubiquinone-9 3-methyltransferase
MRSTSPTDVPPNFITNRDIALRRTRVCNSEAASRRIERALSIAGPEAIPLDLNRFRPDLKRMAATTLDAAEIAKFSALAAEWWNPNGPFGALHRLNPVRLQFIRDLVRVHFATGPRRPLEKLNVLDLGCGGGLVSAPLTRMGANVTAIDASEAVIGAARAYAGGAGLDIDFRCTSAEALVATGAQFDLVTALEIVEHVADVRAFLGAAVALVNPGGVLVLSTINRTPKARALAIVGAERILKWAPEGAHDYDKLVTPAEVRTGAPALDWGEPVGIAYNPLGRGWALSRDTDVNYLMAGRKPKSTVLQSRA